VIADSNAAHDRAIEEITSELDRLSKFTERINVTK
jgi:hypothetical protein